MDSENQIFNQKKLEENKDFFVKYLRFLIRKNYIFSKKPEDLFLDFKSIVFISNNSYNNDFTPLLSTFFDFVSSHVESNAQLNDITYYSNKSKELFVDKRWSVINQCFNDLYFISPTSTLIIYLNLILNHKPVEISEILNITENTILKEIELSRVFMIGWLVRDKNLEKSILPFLGENQIIQLLDFNNDIKHSYKSIDFDEYSEDLKKLKSELDYDIDGMRFMNSKLQKMEAFLTSKTND